MVYKKYNSQKATPKERIRLACNNLVCKKIKSNMKNAMIGNFLSVKQKRKKKMERSSKTFTKGS